MVYDITMTPAGLTRQTGPLYTVFFIYFLVTWVAAIVVFAFKWRVSRGLASAQLQYLGAGIILSGVGGISANLLLPMATGRSTYSWIGPYFSLILVAMVGHAIIRHRLMDLRLFISRGLAYALAMGVASALLITGARLISPAWEAETLFVHPNLVVVTIVALALLSSPAQRFISRLVDPYLHRGIEHSAALGGATRRLSRLMQPAELASELRQILAEVLVSESFTLLVKSFPNDSFERLSMDTPPVDIDPRTYNLSVERLREKLEIAGRAGRLPKLVVPVHFAGQSCEMANIHALSERYGFQIVEDAAHAIGGCYQGRPVGDCRFSDVAVFSFHPVKHLTTGEGGMVTTNDSKLAETLRRFRNHGISSEARQRQQSGQWLYEMVLLGFNYRLTDIACALGLSQLDKLEANLARRRAIAARYSKAFRELPGVIVPAVRNGVEPAWHLYPIRLNLEALAAGRAEIFRALRAENMGVNVHYIPVHKHPYYRERFGYKGGEFPVAEDAYERLISLPMFHAMTDADVEDVIAAVNKVCEAYAR